MFGNDAKQTVNRAGPRSRRAACDGVDASQCVASDASYDVPMRDPAHPEALERIGS
jgi:hypothetical protein